MALCIFRIVDPLREKSLYLELFWSVFYRIRTEYCNIFPVSPYSVRMWENTDPNNSKYGYFVSSEAVSVTNIPSYHIF